MMRKIQNNEIMYVGQFWLIFGKPIKPAVIKLFLPPTPFIVGINFILTLY